MPSIPNDLVPEDDLVPDDLEPEVRKKPEESNWDYLKGLATASIPGQLVKGVMNAKNQQDQELERVRGSEHPLLEIGKIGLEENPITNPILSGISRAKRFAGMGENQEPVTKALRYSQAALAPIPILGDAMESGDKAIMGPEETSKEGIGELGGHLANALLPAIMPSIGRGMGKMGKGIYSKAFPSSTAPDVLDLMMDEGIRGGQKGMTEQVASKIMDKTQEMAQLENSAPNDMMVDYNPTTQMLGKKYQQNQMGAGSVSPLDDKALLDKYEQLINTTGENSIPFKDAIRLKRGVEREGDLAGAFTGSGPRTPKQLAANMATGGMINDIADVYPEYSKTTGGLAKLLDAKRAIAGAKPLRTDLPYRYGPPAIASAEVYRSLHNPILAALTGGGAMELQRALTSPRGLTYGGSGMMGIGALLQNPGIRAALLGMGQQGQ